MGPMSTAYNWETPAEGGYMYSDQLSDLLRTALQPSVKFRQFCNVDDSAVEKGLHTGDKHRWNNYGDLTTQGRKLSELAPMPQTSGSVAQSELTITELGNSVPYTGKLTALAKHDVVRIVTKQL